MSKKFNLKISHVIKTLIYLVPLLIQSCNYSSKEKNKVNSNSATGGEIATDSTYALDIAIDSTFLEIDTVNETRDLYVISRNGTKIWTKSNSDAGCLYFGQPLSAVILDSTTLGIKFNYTSKFISSYVKKIDTGTELEVPLDNFDLNSRECSYFLSIASKYNGDCEENNHADFNPKDYPDLEVNLISKEKFEMMKKTRINHFTPDSTIKKINGTITLKLEKGLKIFKDEDENKYEYIGQIKFFNAYVVDFSCGQCEESFCLLIDMKTGEMILENEGFQSFPDFSANKKYIMTLKPDSYYGTNLVLYKYHKDTSTVISKKFGSWVPMKEGFWGSDDCYYTAVIPTIFRDNYDIYTDSNKRIKTEYNFRYVKIKIKKSTHEQE